MNISVNDFTLIQDVEDHIFELYTNRPPPEDQNLGYVDRSKEVLHISVADFDLTIKQSLSSLSSSKEASSTGFVFWKSTARMVEWILNEKSPFYSTLHNKNDLVVVELGAGIAGVCASILGPKVGKYVATDQKHILKLLKYNIEENTRSDIDVVEYDWEYLEHGLNQYYNLFDRDEKRIDKKKKRVEKVRQSNKPDLIIACDTIYNEYLIPHFIAAFAQLMDDSTGVLVTLQLRESDVMEAFVTEVIRSELNIYCIPEDLLSEQLVNGFVVYYITR